MTSKNNKKIEKIKDWFIIQKIRVTNYIKEHKYISSFIGIFLISCVVALIVFATDSDQYAGKVNVIGTSLLQKSTSSTEEVTTVKSFSNIVYDISYSLSIPDLPAEETVIREQVILEASFNEDIDAEWVLLDEEDNYEVSEDKKTLTLTMYNIKVGNLNSKKVYLKAKNIENGENITTRFKIKESTAADFVDLGSKTVSIESSEVFLTSKIISGTAYKTNDYENGRMAPFGILVGFDLPENSDSLEGIYFNPNLNLTMEASQNISGENSQIELEIEDSKYYGLYDRSLNLFDGLPHYVYDYRFNSVYDSGSIESFSEINGVENFSSENNESPTLYLFGPTELELELGEEYIEYGVSNENNASEFFKICDSCAYKILKGSNEVTLEEMKNNTGEYKIIYTYSESSTSREKTSVERKVTVKAKTQVVKEDTTYELEGNKKQIIIKNELETFELLGLMQIKNNEKSEVPEEDYTLSILKNGEAASEIIDVGEYEITYTIDSDTKLTRNITVVEGLNHIESSKAMIASEFTIPASKGLSELPNVKLNNTDINCSTDSGCSVNFYTISNSPTEYNGPGTYVVVYTLTDSNGFKLQVSTIINVKTKYSLKIKGIKSNGVLNLYDGRFVSLGSYFVTAKSPRPDAEKSDINVNLKINDIESQQPVINKYYSAGTKSAELTFIDDSTGIEKVLTDNDFLSYGEEVVLKSIFNYNSDGDENINSLEVTIPIGKAISSSKNPTSPFTMIEYSSSASDKLPYYINEELKDKITVEYYACKMEESATTCAESAQKIDSFDDDILKEENLKLAYLIYTIENVEPGTKIDFRIRLKTSIGNNNGVITLESKYKYTEKDENKNNEIDKTISSQSKINITPFKARTKVFIGNSEQDTIMDGANVTSNLWTIYPSVLLPAADVNTNSAGIGELKVIEIEVTLDEGINYVYNENYDIPTINGNKLKYTLTDKNINEWIDPIYFETSYNINIPSGSELNVSVVIQAKTTTDVVDSSNEELRTTTRKIIYQNNEIISYGQYTPYTSISKETDFMVSAKLYNNTKNNSYSNISLVTILPYDDSADSIYNGTYLISDLPDGALCTTTMAALINKTSLLNNSIEWEDCANYEEDDYIDVTAIKVDEIALDPEKIYEQSFVISPIGNQTGDVYKINSYLIMDRTQVNENDEIKQMKELEVTVVSKKITGTVWEDFDSDGIMNDEEKKVSGVTLKLYDNDTDELIKTTTTDEKGKYSLTDLEPGSYYVVAEFNTAKYGLTAYQVSSDKTITSAFKTFEAGIANEDPGQEDYCEDEECENNGTNECEDEEECYQEDEYACDGEDCEQDEPICEDDEDCEGYEDEFYNSSYFSLKSSKSSATLPVIRTDVIEITENTKTVDNINLGLALKKIYSVKLNKYITKAITTNQLGISTTKDYGNVSFAKLDVKDISNVNIKVVYTLELENIGYFPGYIYSVKDYIPDGMTFNSSYEENKGWEMTEYGYLENRTLFDELINEGEKKYLTIAFDVTRKEAGSFVNFSAIDDDDLQILVVGGSKLEEGEK